MTRAFGPILGVSVGTTYSDRSALSRSHVHPPTQAGISGSAKEGADSVVVSGGYEDDVDFGDVIIYTGHGGRDARGRQVRDQLLSDYGNAALARSQLEGLPVRVTRGWKGDARYSPASGFRYDGLYRVEDHWTERGTSGYTVCRYRLRRLEEVTEVSTVQADALGRPVTRVLTTVQRQVRNSAYAEFVKRQHSYRCQICGTTLSVAAGAYAEAAHIRALGQPHNGPDEPSNILCLCPNDHVRLDLGGLYLLDDLTVVEASSGKRLRTLIESRHHRINLDHVRYHRERHIASAASRLAVRSSGMAAREPG